MSNYKHGALGIRSSIGSTFARGRCIAFGDDLPFLREQFAISPRTKRHAWYRSKARDTIIVHFCYLRGLYGNAHPSCNVRKPQNIQYDKKNRSGSGPDWWKCSWARELAAFQMIVSRQDSCVRGGRRKLPEEPDRSQQPEPVGKLYDPPFSTPATHSPACAHPVNQRTRS